MYVDVFNWARTCAECQMGKDLPRPRAPLKTLPVEPTIFQRWHADHLAMPEVDGWKYIVRIAAAVNHLD